MSNEMNFYLKENDELVKPLHETDLVQPISELKKSIDTYLYIAKPGYDKFKVEGFVLELDDIFRFYNALIGLYIPKSKMPVVQEVIMSHWANPDFKFAFSYEANEGLAELNLPLDYMKNFQLNGSIGETIAFVEELLEEVSTKIK